jgi:hypothetical protein
MFSQPIAIEAGTIVEREGFVFADLMPAPFGRARADPSVER